MAYSSSQFIPHSADYLDPLPYNYIQNKGSEPF